MAASATVTVTDNPTPAPVAAVDRTPTTSFDAIVKMAIEKGQDIAHPIVMERLVKAGLDDETANQKTSNLLDSIGSVAYDIADIIGDVKIADKARADAKK